MLSSCWQMPSSSMEPMRLSRLCVAVTSVETIESFTDSLPNARLAAGVHDPAVRDLFDGSLHARVEHVVLQSDEHDRERGRRGLETPLREFVEGVRREHERSLVDDRGGYPSVPPFLQHAPYVDARIGVPFRAGQHLVLRKARTEVACPIRGGYDTYARSKHGCVPFEMAWSGGGGVVSACRLEDCS